MARFLMATVPVTGHVQPGVAIARTLAGRGHEVWWYTGEKFRPKVEAVGARFVPITAGRDYDDADLNGAFPGREKLSGLAQLKFDLKHVFTDSAPGQVRDLEEILERFPADAVVNDTAFMGAPLLSERRGTLYGTFGISVLTIPSEDTAPFGLGILPSASGLGRARNRALNWAVDNVMFRDVMAHYRAMRAGLDLPPPAKGFFESSFGPYLYLQATVPSFEYPRRDLPPQVHFVGPFLPEPPGEFSPPPWWHELEGDRPVVHVTQGTSATDSDQLIVPALKALADEDVLVVATTGGKPLASVALYPPPPTTHLNARVATFLPYYHLLPRVQIMITNAGYGGVQMALAHGIPLVAAGASEDKPEIANRIAWSGVGLNLRTKTPRPEQVRAAVRTLLDDPRYRARASAVRAEIEAHDAPALSADLLERLASTPKPV
jgi:UDP:flavonoid glycosyltransferase YjiC (YdhE family)